MAIVLAALSSACGVLLGRSGDDDEPPPATIDDASNGDASVALDAADEGGGTSIVRDDFESEGCPGWEPGGVTRARSPIARTGAGACRICAPSSASSGSDFKRVIPSLGIGQYVLTAHIRAPEPSYATAKNATAILNLYSDAGLRSNNFPVTPTDTYVTAQAYVDFDIPFASGEIFVHLDPQAGAAESCVLVDDVSVVHYP